MRRLSHPTCRTCKIKRECRIKSPDYATTPFESTDKEGNALSLHCKHFRCGFGEMQAVHEIRIRTGLDSKALKACIPVFQTASGKRRLIPVNTKDKEGFVDLEGNFYTMLDGKITKTGQTLGFVSALKRLYRIRQKLRNS